MLIVPPLHVIFDCDGVLADVKGHVARCLMEAMAEAGLAVPFEEVRRRHVDQGMAETVAMVEAATGRAIPERWVERLAEETYIQVKFRSRPIRFVPELLKTLESKRVALSVAAPVSPKRITVALGMAGVLKMLTPRLYSSESFNLDVYCPEVFAFTARTSGIVPNRTVVVVDSVAGVTAAAALGMPAVGFCGDPLVDAASLEAAGATVFKDMRKLPALLRLA